MPMYSVNKTPKIKQMKMTTQMKHGATLPTKTETHRLELDIPFE